MESQFPAFLAVAGLLILAALGAIYWATRSASVPPPRDTELSTTEPADPDNPPETQPGSVVWLQPPWVDTVNTAPADLDEPSTDARERS